MKAFLALALLATSTLTTAAERPPARKTAHPPKAETAKKNDDSKPPVREFFHPSEVRSTGTVSVGGQPVAYDAYAGTLVIRAKDWEDTDAVEADADKSDKDKNTPKPEA